MEKRWMMAALRTRGGCGKVGKGAHAHMHPLQRAATVLKAIHGRHGCDTRDVDDVIWGTSAQKGKQGGDMGRMAALDAGYDKTVSGVTLDRFCGSGLTAVNFAAGQIGRASCRESVCQYV